MSLETRLRDELNRSAPDAIPAGPALDSMRSAVDSRRRRNRLVLGTAAAVLLVAGVAGGVVATRPDSTSDVIAAAPDDEPGGTEEAAGSPAAADDAAVDDPTVAADADPPNATSGADETADEPASAADPASTTKRLAVDTTPVTIETRRSAVDFAGGSGVFVVPTAEGFAGLASRFGGDRGVTMIGLESPNGLDWTEVGLSGVPAGATVTLLREFEGTYVASFSQFDTVNQRNVTRLGTSNDLRSWTGGSELPGDDAVVLDLAVGASGVLAIGTGPAPTVWVGPVAGPYELAGSIDDAVTVTEVVASGDGFVATGTSEGRPALFETIDGSTWTLLGTFDDADSLAEVSVAGATITVVGQNDGGVWTGSSLDGGITWQRSLIDTTALDTAAIRDTAVSFLGTSPLGTPTVTLTDDETWISTELDVAEGDRIELLVPGSETLLLAAGEDGVTWVVASR